MKNEWYHTAGQAPPPAPFGRKAPLQAAGYSPSWPASLGNAKASFCAALVSLANKKLRVLMLVMCAIFGITFSLGIFNNPGFNIHDFCLNLSSEILGLVIALVIVESYVAEKKKAAADSSSGEPEGR